MLPWEIQQGDNSSKVGFGTLTSYEFTRETRKAFSTCSKSPPLAPSLQLCKLTRSQSRTSLLSQTPVSALLASHTGAATLVTKMHIQLTESICTLTDSVLAGVSSLATLPMSTQDTTCLLGPAIVTHTLLQRAKTKLPDREIVGSPVTHQVPHYMVSLIYRWWQRSLLVHWHSAVCSRPSRIMKTEVVSAALEV